MHFNTGFSPLDWGVFLGYFLILGVSSYLLSRSTISSSEEYFNASHSMGVLPVALSLVATSQSAATFLGAPEYAYMYDFTFLGFYVSALLAVLFVAYYFVPRFYAMKLLTVYELLESRYGVLAKQQAGMMFLVGRVMASGARLYIATLAVSMILFYDVSFLHIVLSSSLLLVGALLYTYFGGVKSVILSDVIQLVIYVGAGIVVLVFLYSTLDIHHMWNTLHEYHKLRVLDTSLEGKFSLVSLLTGWLLLNIAAFGLDQDMSQRVLTCKDKKGAQNALVISIVITIPIVVLFLAIGSALFVHYEGSSIVQKFDDEKITIFMYYILNELPDGLKGFVTVGAIAAALSSTNSVLSALASVAVEDIYKPWIVARRTDLHPHHFLRVARLSVLGFASLLLVMVVVSYEWQHVAKIPLVSFALGVMSFAYSGLLGVFFSAVFTQRGDAQSVPYALGGGFLVVLFLQPYFFGIHIGFAWQIVIATGVSFAIMQMKRGASYG